MKQLSNLYNMTTVTKTEYIIDAKNKRLGKVATEAASILNGKNSPQFAAHILPPVTVKIENAHLLDIPEKKQSEIYQSYSGYPGGRKTERLDHLAKRLGYAAVLERTIKGMLPKNKLQKLKMQNLIISE